MITPDKIRSWPNRPCPINQSKSILNNQWKSRISDQSGHRIPHQLNLIGYLTQESDSIIWPNQKITLIIFWLVRNGKDWNQAIPLVKRIFLVPDHIWPKTIKGQPALTHVIRNYVLLLVVPPLCLWWVTHIVTKALRLKILPGQQLPLFPTHPTLLTFTKVSKLRA